MKVGLGLLHVVCGINVASRWGCVQGVCEQCRCWSLGMGNRVSSVGRWDYKVAVQNCECYLGVRSGVGRGVCVCVRACVVQCGVWLVGCVVCSLAL